LNAHFIENLPIEPRFLSDRPKSNTEKVAILLASLEHSLAIDLLKKFEPEDVKQILESSSKLGALKSGDVEPLVEEFSNEFSRALGISAGSDQLMVLLESAFTSEQVARLLGRPISNNDASVWSKFSTGIETTLVPYLLDEHEQTAAIILSKLPADLVARCLAQFPRKSSASIVVRLLKMGKIEQLALDALETVLTDDLFSNSKPDDGQTQLNQLATVVNRLERKQSIEIMEDLAQSNPEDLAALRKLIFMFEDIHNLEQKHRLKLFDKVPTELVIPALFGCSAEFREQVLSSMGARARRMVESELQGDLSQLRRDTPDAQRKIADIAIQMARKMEIELPEPSETSGAKTSSAA
jgi:flagellar motor switch protein FliG